MWPLLTRKHAEKASMGEIRRARGESCVSEPVGCQAYGLNSPLQSIPRRSAVFMLAIYAKELGS